MGDYLFNRLQDLYHHAIVGQVRGGLGLLCAVEIVQDRQTREHFPSTARLALRADRLMTRYGLLGRGGDIFFLAPPLSVTRSEIDYLVYQLDAILTDLEAELGVQ